jgi:hypothetical protein
MSAVVSSLAGRIVSDRASGSFILTPLPSVPGPATSQQQAAVPGSAAGAGAWVSPGEGTPVASEPLAPPQINPNSQVWS